MKVTRGVVEFKSTESGAEWPQVAVSVEYERRFDIETGVWILRSTEDGPPYEGRAEYHLEAALELLAARLGMREPAES